jgi:arginyl-tRNA synthetase
MLSLPATFSELKSELSVLLGRRIEEVFGVEHRPAAEVPPRRSFGDLAFPAALHLARTLRRKPREIATALADGFEPPPFVDRLKIEGPGYLNFFLDRSACVAGWLRSPVFAPGNERGEKIIVEHTNINPNKAAHIGHLRNAVLGDVLTRALRRLGHPVEVQNYIDDTGVQLADVVVGFADLRRLSCAEIAALPEPFDYTCWDLYSEVGRWYGEDPSRRERRQETLHALEVGEGPRAEIGRLVAHRVVGRHLATMRRIGVGYDVLTRESDILGRDFFARAFEELKASGAVHLAEEGKNRGCWVMPLADSAEFAGLEDPDKVIVRSDGTVTYTGKDIAYQLWKFGLLGCDFGYCFWEEEEVWETASEEVAGEHPSFGAGQRVINVIDARQSYLQRVVRAGLEALGHRSEAERSIHFAYEMVSLSRATAEQLGYLAAADGDEGKPSLEMSGRKGIGVKADDLLDQMEEKALEKIVERYPELSSEDLADLARQVATAALRFFMMKATTTRVIAFDFDEAINFEGETGPYLQYSMVRELKIRRRLAEAGMASEVTAGEVEGLAAGVWADDLWDLVLQAVQGPEVVARAADTLELSLIARQALDLAAKFHSVYHRHRILDETDESLRRARMAAFEVFRKHLGEILDLIGVPVPEKM